MRHLFTLLAGLALGSAGWSGTARAVDNETPVITVGTCIEHGGTVEQPEGSPIRACCMTSDVGGYNGCYICDYKWENCVWDPSYAQGGGKRPYGLGQSVGPLDAVIDPGPGAKPGVVGPKALRNQRYNSFGTTK